MELLLKACLLLLLINFATMGFIAICFVIWFGNRFSNIEYYLRNIERQIENKLAKTGRGYLERIIEK